MGHITRVKELLEKEGKMTFQEAKEELAILAKNRFHTISYELTIFPKGLPSSEGRREVNCVIYVDGLKHFQAPTWRGCLDLLKAALGSWKIDRNEEPKEEV